MSDVYVVAGTYNEYVNYARNKTDDNFYIYVNSPDMLRGLRDPHGVFIGTWIDRPDIEFIILNLGHATTTATTYSPGVKRAFDLLRAKEAS